MRKGTIKRITRNSRKSKTTSRHTSRYTNKNKNNYNYSNNTNNLLGKDLIKVNLKDEKQAELLMIYMILVNYTLLMLNEGKTKTQIKTAIIKLLHQLRSNGHHFKEMTNAQFNKLFEEHYKNVLELRKGIDKKIKAEAKYIISKGRDIKGGFYFKNLEEKGDQPITGNDLAKFLDEMQQFFYNAQYTDEGAFLRNANTVISMLRGDLSRFKGVVQYQILPKYYSPFPPFIKWGNIKKDFIDNRKWEDIPDYLLAYQSYLRSRDEYLVEKGLKSPSVLQKDLYTGFYDKLARSLDTNIYKMQQYRMKAKGNFYPLSLPA